MGKLVRLELFNFKSYKGHHVLLMGDETAYFTSIIGPNGSGKSNSMDAISFVLGIKSSHLRSSHLRDLIYRGRILNSSKINADGTATAADPNDVGNADNREVESGDEQPTPNASQRKDPQAAWVMAVYEDDTGVEQRWKRSITASGQSEYRINNRVVVAKEYHEALEAENILIKARNFLVFQGDVEAIASQSPKDLTRLVEQISGSLEYKEEYDRLEKTAEAAAQDQLTKFNLRRGINAEIKQFGDLSKEADNFNRKVDERDDAVVNHVLWKLYHFQRNIEESGAEMQRYQDELKEFRRQIQKYEQTLENARSEQAKAGRDVAKAERAIKAMEKDAESKQSGLVPIDEKIANLKVGLATKKERVNKISKERDTQTRNLSDLKGDLSTVQKAEKKWEDDEQKRAKNEGRQLSEAELKEYRALKAEVNRKTASAQSELDNIERISGTDEDTVKTLRGKVDDSERRSAILEGETLEARKQLEEANQEIKQLSTTVNETKKAYNTLVSDKRRTDLSRQSIEEKLGKVLKQLDDADDGRRESEKDKRMKETLATLKRHFPGVRGRIAELCKPKQKKYEVAVTTVLGRQLNTIVTDTQKTSEACIQYLKMQQLGVHTFAPLDSIQVKSINSNLRGMSDKMRLAIDTIEFDSSLERAMSYVCGDCMVCDDYETARYLRKDRGIRAKAVTLEGAVLSSSGLITGGRGPSDNRSKVWEDASVDKLVKEKDRLLEELRKCQPNEKAAIEERNLQSELSTLELRLSTTQSEVSALQRNVKDKEKEFAFVRNQLKEIKAKWQEQQAIFENHQNSQKQYRDKIREVENHVFASLCQRLGYSNIQEYEALQGSQQQEIAQKRLNFNMQKTKLENQIRFEETQVQKTKERVKSQENQIIRDNTTIEDLNKEKDQIQGELDLFEEQLTAKRAQIDKLRKGYNATVESVAGHRRTLQKQSKDVDSVQKTVAGLEADVQKHATGRFALLRKCKIDEIQLPLAEGSQTLDALPIEAGAQEQGDVDAMDVDEDLDISHIQIPVLDYGIELNFDDLDDDLKEDDSDEQDKQLQATITSINTELGTMNPNVRAVERLESAKERLDQTDEEFQVTRKLANRTKEEFEKVREKRAELFTKALDHISEQIDPTYKALTRSQQHKFGGQAFLRALEAEDDKPFLGGLKYDAMPPLKRFRDMDSLSGGEKTIAALALLFAIHNYSPSPFFVLDEVDAALDNTNVAKVANYIREHARPGMQFIVISLKAALFQESECLVGIMRDQTANTSRAVTLDLRKYRPT